MTASQATDKELCYTHIDTVKKTDIVVIATQSKRQAEYEKKKAAKKRKAA